MTKSTTKQAESKETKNSVKVEYKGPSIHRRVITKQQLADAGVQFGESDKKWEGLVFNRHGRMPLFLDELTKTAQEQIIAILSEDPAFEITVDGDVVAEASPDAGHTLADGSNAASGAGADPELAESIGMSQGGTSDLTAGTTGTSGGVGGSTAGS